MEHSDALADLVRRLLETVCHITTAHQTAKNLYVHRLAPNFNAFDFIVPDEAGLSKIIAWFLDPRQTHGQSTRFLRLLLDELGESARAMDCDRAEVRTEVTITQGRLDILISMSGLHVAVENKPWAADQEEQVRRYLEYFDTCGQVPSGLSHTQRRSPAKYPRFRMRASHPGQAAPPLEL